MSFIALGIYRESANEDAGKVDGVEELLREREGSETEGESSS